MRLSALASPIPLRRIVLADERQFFDVFFLPSRLTIEPVECGKEGIDDQHEQQAEADDEPACQHDRVLTRGHLVPSFSDSLHHGRRHRDRHSKDYLVGRSPHAGFRHCGLFKLRARQEGLFDFFHRVERGGFSFHENRPAVQGQLSDLHGCFARQLFHEGREGGKGFPVHVINEGQRLIDCSYPIPSLVKFIARRRAGSKGSFEMLLQRCLETVYSTVLQHQMNREICMQPAVR